MHEQALSGVLEIDISQLFHALESIHGDAAAMNAANSSGLARAAPGKMTEGPLEECRQRRSADPSLLCQATGSGSVVNR